MPAARDGSRTKRPVEIAQLRLIAKVARMYHEGGVRQPQIAAELSLSQARVSRLLRQASEIGVVRTVVTLPPGVYTDLEEQLQEKFNLRDAVIVDVDGARGQVVPALGAATAQYLNSTLMGGEVLGVSSWSATLLAAAEVMPARSTSPLDRVVQIVGGHGDPGVQVQANRLTGELAAVTGARPVFLPAPGLVSSPALRRALVKDASIGDVMKSWKELDLALVGIGSLEPSPLLRQSGNALTEAEQDQLRNAGAVGDVCLRFFDVNGATVKTSLDERVMSITPADLMRVPRRVGVAGGASKYPAIRAALRGAWVNVLVTDLDTARDLVEDTEARPADLLSAEGLGQPTARRPSAHSYGPTPKEITMEYTRLGDTGLKISRLALGCMSYGDPTTEGAHRWALADDEAQPYFAQAVELGITFWDTANVYQAGTSEEVVGRAIQRYSRREDIVLATKVFGKMHDGPGGSGLSRKAILEQVDASLTRLGTDYIDLYQIHRFDPDTPAAETMEALHDIVKAGKVRYLGASSMFGWQFAKLQRAAEVGGWTRFVSMQNQYNLLRRQDEPELMALCTDTGVGLVPYSPNGKGRLARPWGQQSTRSSVDHVVQAFDSPTDEPVVNAVQKLAETLGVTMAQIALAWVLRHPAVSAPIVGATKPHHLPEAVAALDLTLTDDAAAALEEPYTNHGPSWY